MRCLPVEGSTNALDGQAGLFFAFTTGTTQYGFPITPTKGFSLVGNPSWAGPPDNDFDNHTAFHDYVFDWISPSSFTLYRDGVAVVSGAPG